MTEHVSFIRPRWLTGSGLWRDGQEVITFDLTSTETHEASNIITDHGVEEGANVSDHVQPQPRTVSMEVEMTATPLSPRTAEPNIIEQTHQLLVKLADEGAPLRVVTTLEDYGNMVLQRYQSNVGEDTGERLVASLDFKEVRVAFSETVDLDAAAIQEEWRPSGREEEDSGRQTSGEPTEEQEEQGVTILGGIFGVDE